MGNHDYLIEIYDEFFSLSVQYNGTNISLGTFLTTGDIVVIGG